MTPCTLDADTIEFSYYHNKSMGGFVGVFWVETPEIKVLLV